MKRESKDLDDPLEIKRISSGIPGLDELMEGGFVKGSTNLLAGQAGTCKTIFGCQFLWEGLQKGENGLYVTLEESAKDIINDALQFGWDFSKYIKERKCNIVEMKSIDLNELTIFIADEIKSLRAERFVLDSLSVASMSWKSSPEELFKIRIGLFNFIKSLKELNVTSLLISEIQRGKQTLGRFGFEEFLVDGVIILQLVEMDVPMRSIQITKMRRTNHSVEVHPFSITKKGIVIKKI
jgi:KaiC/GvpD/RAD55 family RecA-like ATPase